MGSTENCLRGASKWTHLKADLARGVLALFGWRVRGGLPDRPVVLACGPHTSNWDFMLGLLGTRALGSYPAVLVKSSLVRGPVGALVRALGGVGVSDAARSGQSSGTVGAATVTLRGGRSVALLPKGTRRSGVWRSGFYRMALAAQVPVCMMTFDAGKKLVTVFGPYRLTGVQAVDQAWFESCMDGVVGVRPDVQEQVRVPGQAELAA